MTIARRILSFCCFLSFLLVFCVLARASEHKDDNIVLGFVQVSAEGTWRMTNSMSIKSAAEDAGIRLIFREGKNNYSNQINEMRELIAMGVDVLAFAPSQEGGWDSVLEEAWASGVPVIVVDRAIETADDSLYVTHIGSDMIDEGRRAAKWMIEYMESKGRGDDQIKIAVLEGVRGSTPAIHRSAGFMEIIGKHPNYSIVQFDPANYIFSKGKEVTANFLRAENGDIDVIFAHNDEMALGAIEAVREYGKKPGEDIVIIGVDAIKEAFKAIVKGDMNCTIECSPLLGPQLMEAVKDIVAGRKVSKRVITVEHDYDIRNAEEELPNRTY